MKIANSENYFFLVSRINKKCSFPHWLTTPHTWHTLSHTVTYHYNHHEKSLRIYNTTRNDDTTRYHDKKVICVKKQLHSDHAVITTYVTAGW